MTHTVQPATLRVTDRAATRAPGGPTDVPTSRTTQVCITAPPTGSPVVRLRGRFAPQHGTFALLVRPAEKARGKRTRKTVSVPFFHALGKNLSTVGAYTNQTSEFRAQIAHWFAAYDAKELVVFDAHALYPGTMRAIFEYACTVPRITFACEPGYYERTRDAVHAAGATTTPLAWDTLVHRLPLAPDRNPAPAPSYEMRHLPECDFLLFRHNARVLNTPERFKAINTDYRNAYKHALDLDLADGLDAVVATIARVTADAVTTAPIMVALRATQAALLTRGWLLTAHRDKALGTLCSVRSPNPTDEHWAALHGYVRTARVAGVTLYLLNVPPNDLNAVTIGDVQDALDLGHLRGTPIPDLARPLLKAHLHHRADQDAEPTDPYLNQKGPRRHLEDLIDARRHLGIPIDARFLRGGSLTHAERPIWRFGLDLRNLT